MDAEWGGLDTLWAAAKFVELQDQEKNQKLIEICEEYPSSDKSSYSTESASSLTPIQSAVASPSPPTISSVAPKNVSPQTTSSFTNTDASSATNITLSTITSLPTLTNGSSPAVAVSTLPSFSPSPSLTFTFTTPSNANSQTPLLKIPPTNSRLPSASLPRHITSPLVIQRTCTSPPPPLLPPSRTVQHHSQPPQTLQNSMSTIAIIPHRTYTERSNNVTDIKRKMSNSGTREVHNKLEKNRRAHLKECFELLKSQVPAIQDEKKPSNLTILRTAIRYVTILRNREQQLETELEKLAREKIINQQRLTTLKKELSAQWDHIDFNSLLPESVDSKSNVPVENGGDHKDYDMDRDTDKIAVMSDADDTSSHVKSRGDTYYGSSSSTGSCSISPLHISSPNMVSTTTDTLPPQIHIVESTSVPFDKLSSTTVVSPLQFLSTSTLRMITESEPIALVQHNGGEKLMESSNLPKMAVHSGNTFTIFSDSFQKVAVSNNPASASSNVNPAVRNTKLTNSSVQYTTGLTIPPVTVSHKTVSLPVKSGFSQVTTNGTMTTSSGERNSNNVLTNVPVHSNVGNIVNHSFVVTQPSSGQMLLTTASPHLSSNVMPTPLLKTVSRLQPINGHQLVVKPTMVVVSSSTAASK